MSTADVALYPVEAAKEFVAAAREADPVQRGAGNCIVLIPAYRPGAALVSLVEELRSKGAGEIVVVDDGSGAEYRRIFEALRLTEGVTVLSHAANSGKGAALKTGMRYILDQWPEAAGVLTADADGQHHAGDILRVRQTFLETPDSLVLGARAFEGPVPARSRFGNSATSLAMRLLLGRRLRDTQTGLRAIPAALIPALLRVHAHRYEFELEMLVAAKHLNTPIVETAIRTIYEDGNKSSHFNPLVDSMRIYFVLLRFSMISMATSAIDNAIFMLALWFTGGILVSQLLGRAMAVGFNYSVVRKAVFHSERGHAKVLPAYLSLVVVSGSLSYGSIVLLSSRFHMPVVAAKIVAETALFFVNFAVQRDFVFSARRRSAKAAARV